MNIGEDEVLRQKRTKAMYSYIYGNWYTMIVYVYAELGIADHLLETPMSASAIAKITETDTVAMGRILQCAEVLGLHKADPKTGNLVLTGLGKLLASSTQGSLRAAARLNGAPYRYGPWEKLLEYARSGSGKGLSPTWEDGSLPYLKQHPELLEVFEEAMTDLSRSAYGDIDENRVIAQEIDCGSCRCVIDIGGGNGALISEIVEAHPHVEGVLFDLPEVIASVHMPTTRPCEPGQAYKIAGDFFQSVPSGYDLYIMKNVIHNGPETHCINVLRSVHDAMTADNDAGSQRDGKRLILFEMVLEDGAPNAITRFTDLNMNLLVGGVSRSKTDFAELLGKCGFVLLDIKDLPGLERKAITATLASATSAS